MGLRPAGRAGGAGVRVGDVEAERRDFRRNLRASLTDAERRLWYRLRDRRLAGFKFVRQETIGRYVADFCCRDERLIVEVDGGQHAGSEHDRVRDAWRRAQGYRVLRFWNAEIMTNTVGVTDTILAALPPSPPLRGEGRAPLAGGEASPKGEGEGGPPDRAPSGTPPHPRLPPRFADDKVGKTLSPQAGRGGEHA
ncbi:endonuclease domain-containing protein [Methylobacterium sp. J-076]|uniref:endonuclease domain-containing protein n=1 Tax=Methylobacterium sp. J-076 TaxID=2836655 RepID=UPI001FBABAB5|nr:endonuclease domain-containing protein [Methylobacterium sp. J-076]MCJ2014959.1 endonuclease domain-containing protein [Methylobacterium sp. J-076]